MDPFGQVARCNSFGRGRHLPDWPDAESEHPPRNEAEGKDDHGCPEHHQSDEATYGPFIAVEQSCDDKPRAIIIVDRQHPVILFAALCLDREGPALGGSDRAHRDLGRGSELSPVYDWVQCRECLVGADEALIHIPEPVDPLLTALGGNICGSFETIVDLVEELAAGHSDDHYRCHDLHRRDDADAQQQSATEAELRHGWIRMV